MIITYYGHSFFTLALENGMTIALDPYGDFYGYPKRSVQADVCLISHHHHDHDGVSSLRPGAKIIDQPGLHRLADGVTVTGISTWHDDRQGALRGPNIFYIVEAEGLRIGHAGDLGCMPDESALSQIGGLDVLMLPVGGCYTIDAAQARQIANRLSPRVVIPMHYQTSCDPEMPIAPVTVFLSLMGAQNEQAPLLRVTAADIGQRPPVVTLAVRQG
ncbi:MAG: MBL fold metallo-hydrolase [Clostridiales bacterium]|nr:MBL fold metallo-hydrolase [Clostridiales bacterium]